MICLTDIVLLYITENKRTFFKQIEKCEIILPFHISQQILQYFDQKYLGISEEDLLLFHNNKLTFKNIIINCHRIEHNCYLSFIKNHPIEILSFQNLRNCNFTKWLTEKDGKYLKELNISRVTFHDKIIINEIKKLHILKNIEILNVSFTSIDDNCLEFICNNFINLKDLNITDTKITTIKPVINLKKLLAFKFAEVYNVPQVFYMETLKYLTQLEEIYLPCKGVFYEPNGKGIWLKNLLKEATWINLRCFRCCKAFELDENTIQ